MPADFQSALHPAGPQAAQINTLWWFLLIVAALVWAAFVTAVVLAIRQGRFNAGSGDGLRATTSWAVARRVSELIPEPHPSSANERRLHVAIAAAVGVSATILLAFLVASYLTGRGVSTIVGPQPLVVKIVGHQWWWDVEYVDTDPSRRLRSANELHIPVGRPVVLHLESRDVIHSLWVPNLGGKKDLIPGYTTIHWLRADRPGVFRSQCAEFCGHQHAKMALMVVAHPAEEFDEWFLSTLAPAAEPRDSVAAHGRLVFESTACAMCHTISGTLARSRVGPDLTHIGSRLTIAAGTLPNTRGNLAGWIMDPQRIKPGARMPPQSLSPDQLHAVLTYLGGLK